MLRGQHPRKIFTYLAAIFFFAGCGPQRITKDEFYVLTVGGMSNIDLRLNGEPADGGGMVTLFVVNGSNELVIRGDTLNGYLVVHFGTTSDVFRGKWHPLWEISSEKGVAVETNKLLKFKFTANVPWRWAWEDADKIGTLSNQDKTEIIGIFDHFVKQLTNVTVSAKDMLDPNLGIPWGHDPKKISETTATFEKMLLQVRAYQDITFERASDQDLVFDLGIKILALRSKAGTLYHYGHSNDYEPKNGEMVWNFTGDVMHFVKFKGHWKQLLMTE